MNPDRATLNFLNSFNEEVRKEGENLHRDRCVTQIFGNHLFIQGRVELGAQKVYTTTIRLKGDDWVGSSTSSAGSRCPCLVATMIERMERGENLPENPNEVGEKTVEELLEEKLQRELTENEEFFLNKLEKRYRKFIVDKEIFDHDLVRLHPKWDVTGYEPLNLWPSPPEDIVEFWNYIAYAFDKKNLKIQPFLAPITNTDAIREKIESWEREQETGIWEERMMTVTARPPEKQPVRGNFRMLIMTSEAKLQWLEEGTATYATITDAVDLHRLLELHEASALRMNECSALLWMHFLAHRQETGTDSLRLEHESNCRFLNHLFEQSELANSLVTLDEEPFARVDEPLSWICSESIDGDPTLARLELVTSDGERIPYSLRVLPGVEDFYLSDEAVCRGPHHWVDGTEVLPSYDIPLQVLANETGVDFLARVEAKLPPSLIDRVQDVKMTVKIRASLTRKLTAAESEHMLLDVTASDDAELRKESLGRESWVVEESKPTPGDHILRFDRASLHRFPVLLEPLNVSYDQGSGTFKTRIVKNFPERFIEWVKMLPEDVLLETDADLGSLQAAPVKASMRFEVTEQEIDWFDLKVVLDIEGHDLTTEEIRALVAARGEFVRMKAGGWLRLQFDMNEDQMDAVTRLGLDPFDLSQETHRMHALQLADPMAKDVFDPDAWDRICDSAANVKLKVRPAIPLGLDVTLRPYQVEGYHYLAYLTTNRFGGILADDMGLGKTVQALTWYMWLRSQNEGKDHQPALVVCPKSVLDVWAGEVKKFAPEVRVQVLRTKDELDMDVVREKVDILVLNYSQMRVCADDLVPQHWLAIILDEGQQIKNPDSKAAKVSRLLKADNRLVLTGTPIENRLLDVWSLMSFAMPGVLGNRKYFRERFDRRKDAQAQMRLSARLRPFLLRRTKNQVAMDLPPRTEEDVLCKMEGAQDRLYTEELERVQKQLLGFGTDENLRKNSFIVLQGLMRLRQICCHPALISPAHANESSAKMNALFYTLDQLREEGHKVLVFSQFVKMLNIIRDRLESENRPFHYLTGQTKDRGQVVEDFQKTKDASVFLLSLKAGGSGLNLTAASYVVLYDPWWNPAVEAQAIDRTHRIGQKSKVIAYRLLMRNSVEEKIRVMQKQKSELVDGVLGEESFTKNLQMKDIQYIFSRDDD
jgi:SNF2 family DNA or RNA helicase